MTTSLEREHLDWSNKQGRILSADGNAPKYYTRERGYPYRQEELPHHHLIMRNSRSTFSRWCHEGKQERQPTCDLICGAWTRTLFVGGWEFTTSHDEIVYNVQTRTLFVDIRIPATKPKLFERLAAADTEAGTTSSPSLLSNMDDLDLRLYARQHAFGGYTRLNYEEMPCGTYSVKTQSGTTPSRDNNSDSSNNKRSMWPVCTRHHCIDWNYVGVPRPRPNKWWVEMHPSHHNTWKEWAYAVDDFGQHYYCEQWDRLDGDEDGTGLVLAFRKGSFKKKGVEEAKTRDEDAPDTDDDGIVVVVGNHFNYIHSRKLTGHENKYDAGNLVDLVDMAISAGDRRTAESYLSIDAGHGTISSGWIIDCSLQSWRQGTSLFVANTIHVQGETVQSCHIVWNDKIWDIYECSLGSVRELEDVLLCRLAGSKL